MRPWIVAAVALAVLAVAGGLLYVRSEGALFARGHHQWQVVIEPEADGDWGVFVPRLTGASDAIDPLLESLEVTEGSAGFALDGMRLRVDGDGRAVLVARREFSSLAKTEVKEAFTQWSVPDLRVEHATGPTLRVTWSVDFSGGGGHTCWASATLVATVAANETRELAPAEAGGPPGSASRPWATVCA